MIFGAGINQMELIRAAKELGVTSVVIDPMPDPPGKAEADFFYRVDGKDYETTKSIAIKHGVIGIVTGQMENPLRLMAKLAEELGFIFNTKDVIEKSLDKWLMKNAFLNNMVPTARGLLLKKDKPPEKGLFEQIGYPLILKPKDSFSSRGVYKIECFDDLLKHIHHSRNFSSNGNVIIEEFLEGREFSVETITYKGETTIIQHTEKFITPYPYTVEMGHLQPAELTDTEKNEINHLVISAIKAIGIDNTASHAEVMLTKEGPKMIEIGARLGGDFISSYLTRTSTGINLDKATIKLALGDPPDIERTADPYSYIKYFNLPAGAFIQEIGDSNELRELPFLVFHHLFLKPGDLVTELTHSAQRSGCLLVKGQNRKEVISRAKLIEKRIISKIRYRIINS